MPSSALLVRKSDAQVSPAAMAWQDVRAALRRPRLWTRMAWHDVRLQFDRSRLGPVWMVVQAAAWVGAIVLVFGGVLGEVRDYAVYVAIGIVLYNFITVMVTDSGDIYPRNRIVIHSHPNPYFSYVLRQLGVGLIQLALQSIVVIAVFVIAGHALDATAIWAVPGLAIGVAMGAGVALLFSCLGLRYGDFRFAMLAIMRLGLFVTPILWSVDTDLLGSGAGRELLAALNPMTHFIDLVRMPLMGEIAPALSWWVALGCTALVWVLGWSAFVRLRATIPMWV